MVTTNQKAHDSNLSNSSSDNRLTSTTTTASAAAQSNLTATSIQSVANADRGPEEEQQRTPSELSRNLTQFTNENTNRSSLTFITPLSTCLIIDDWSNYSFTQSDKLKELPSIYFKPCAAVEATPGKVQDNSDDNQASHRVSFTESKRIQLFFCFIFSTKKFINE